jgi:hypothetical protein
MASECPVCHSPFTCQLSQDSHQKLYPSHFTATPTPNLQVDALPETRIKRPKRKKEKEDSE